MSTSSVFPLEIYEHILELFAEHPDWLITVEYTLFYVCTAWRWKCRALVFRYVTIIGAEAIQMMLMTRRKLIRNPHLAELVEDVELNLTDAFRKAHAPIVEAFPSMLGRFLPRLRRVVIVSLQESIPIHPYFSIRRVQLPTVTVLDVSRFVFDRNFTFEWLIAPFPSLRVLDLHRVGWAVVPTLERMPPLVNLAIRLIGNEIPPIWTKENRIAYEHLLNVVGPTLRSLTIDLFPICILTSLHDLTSESIHLSALEELNLELHAYDPINYRGEDGKLLPYSQCVADMVSFIRRVDAKKTRILNLSFDFLSESYDVPISANDFRDYLHSVREEFEGIFKGDHFPALQAINLAVIGYKAVDVPVFQEMFESCFPLLAEQQLLHVKESKDIWRILDDRPRHRIR